MSGLDLDQQELIFDYCIGLSGPAATAKARELISHNFEAGELYNTINEALAPLAYLPPELCPEDLADRTVRRLGEFASRRAVDEEPTPRVVRLGFLRNVSNAAGVVVIAASIVLVIGIAMQSSGLMRQRSYNQICRNQLGNIYRALDLYSADYGDLLPVVARADGAFWHRIGDQSPQNASNTQPLYLLLAHNYTETPDEFICCSRILKNIPHLKRADIASHRDFPSRSHVTYSYRLMPHPKVTMATFGARPLMADMNPHFETLLSQVAPKLPLQFDKDALRLNSANHGRRGQNVLSGDGHARYWRTRLVGNSRDDIYTMEDGAVGGCKKLPACLNDAFLAP